MRDRGDRRVLDQVVGVGIAMDEPPREGAQTFELVQDRFRAHGHSMPRPREVLAVWYGKPG